ncbi:hypothetical protein AB0G60_16840 [Streptomyces angustmyceticus]|nr:hypothetical protein [Streptomyces angustmyceticus]UAL70996.1 hypothetical protein K7396_34320 [Streptomyces angustmyceticus]
MRADLLRLGVAEGQLVHHMAAELMRSCAMRPRLAWRLANELTLDEVAGRFNALLSDPRAPMKGARIWDYEQWPARGTRPSMKALRTLSEIYGVSWDELVDYSDLQHLPEAERAAYHAAAAQNRTRTGAPDSSDTKRNMFDGAPGTSRPAFAMLDVSSAHSPGRPPTQDIFETLERSSEESLQLAFLATETNVDEEVLGKLHQELLDLTYVLMRSPLPISLRRALQLRDRVTSLLRDRQQLAYTRELYLLAAKTCALLAWLCEDLGHHAAALTHVRAGWMCAEQADHDGARRWIRAVQSRLAFWAGDYPESARLAADGRRRSFPDGTDSYLTLLEARAWGAEGEAGEALALLAQWEHGSVYDADPNREDVFFNLTQDRERYLAGGSLLLLNRTGDSLAKLRGALTLHERLPRGQRYYGMEMLTRIDLARAYLRKGELDAVPDTLDPVLEVRPTQRLTMLRLSLQELLAEVSGPPYRNSHLSRELHERIKGFCTTGVADGNAGQVSSNQTPYIGAPGEVSTRCA